MSATYWVYGIRPPNEKFNKMKAAWEACEAAGVQPPEEVIEFFEGDKPDKKGVKLSLHDHECVSEWQDVDGKYTSKWGYEVDLSKAPKDVTIIRFTIS